jgi:Ca2+-binding RTX toxin-like protein
MPAPMYETLSGLEALLSGAPPPDGFGPGFKVSPATENAIIQALNNAGQLNTPNSFILVDAETIGGSNSVTTPAGTGLFVDLAPGTSSYTVDPSNAVIAAGDGSNVTIMDNGPGPDTLIGGTGTDSLSVTVGNNELIAGSGPTTLTGGAGLDTL